MPRHLLTALLFLTGACVDTQRLGSDCDLDGGCHPSHVTDAMGAVNITLPFEPEPLTGIASMDLLLVIDDSPGMTTLQAELAAALPGLVESLLRGDLDGGGFPEFHPLREVRVAVVAANRGQGSALAPGCTIHPPGQLSTGGACPTGHPGLLRYTLADGGSSANDLGCAVQLGANGCGISQPLEAMLQGMAALQVAQGGVWADDSVQLALVLTDNEDCSTEDMLLYAPDVQLDVNDPLRGMPDALRCVSNPSRLAGVLRYSQGLQGLRPGASGRVLFAAIAGFPEALVSPDVYRQVRFSDTADRDQLYGALLGNMELQYGDALGPTGHPGNACGFAMQEATPARRLAELARALGQTARVSSMCGPFDDALTPVLDLVSSTVGLAGL